MTLLLTECSIWSSSDTSDVVSDDHFTEYSMTSEHHRNITVQTEAEGKSYQLWLYLCQELCLDMENCQYLSYFDENATPLSGVCELFRTCEAINNCSNCYTENIDCRTCGTNVVGDLNENVEDIISFVESEEHAGNYALRVTISANIIQGVPKKSGIYCYYYK